MRILTRLAVAGLLFAAACAPATAMTLLEAAQRLAFERQSAISCATVTKRHLPEGDAAAYSRAELAYEAARAEFTAAITGLEIALITGEESEAATLDAVSARLARGEALREDFCADARALLPPTEGERSWREVVVDLGGGLMEALQELWSQRGALDERRRANLRTALESARWPAFDAI